MRNKFSPSNLIDLSKLDEFRAAVKRIDNLPPKERGLIIAAELLPVMKHLWPDLTASGALDPFFDEFGRKTDQATTDVNGGRDAPTPAETLQIHLAANADALSDLTGLSRSKAFVRVSDWARAGGEIVLGEKPVGLTKHTLKNWGHGGKQLAVHDRPDRLGAHESIVTELVTTYGALPPADAEEALRQNVLRLCERRRKSG